MDNVLYNWVVSNWTLVLSLAWYGCGVLGIAAHEAARVWDSPRGKPTEPWLFWLLSAAGPALLVTAWSNGELQKGLAFPGKSRERIQVKALERADLHERLHRDHANEYYRTARRDDRGRLVKWWEMPGLWQQRTNTSKV